VEVANAGARLILAPDWKPIVWTEEERKKGQAWGLKTIESFHSYGTPPVDAGHAQFESDDSLDDSRNWSFGEGKTNLSARPVGASRDKGLLIRQSCYRLPLK
jgi:hypothetical protein